MEHEALYWAVGYLLMAIFLIILGGLPLWPPFTWRNPKAVAAGSYLFRLYESFIAKARKRAAPFMKERDKVIMATAWRGDFSYITPIFGYVDGLFKNSDKLSAQQREARAFYCVFAILSCFGGSIPIIFFVTAQLFAAQLNKPLYGVHSMNETVRYRPVGGFELGSGTFSGPGGDISYRVTWSPASVATVFLTPSVSHNSPPFSPSH